MDLHTAWMAARSAAVAAALLVHGTPQRAPLLPEPQAVSSTAAHAEWVHQLPHPMSVDQVLAAMHR